MANKFKIKNGIVIDSAETELINVSGNGNVLLSTSNEANGNVDTNTTYANTLETQKENIAAHENAIATITNIAYESVNIPEFMESASYPGLFITQGPGLDVSLQFYAGPQSLIEYGDTSVTVSTLCGLTATLPIDNNWGGASPYSITLGTGAEANAFYNAAMACNGLGTNAQLSDVFSKSTPAHTEFTKVITFDKNIYDQTPSGEFTVNGANEKYAINQNSVQNNYYSNRIYPSWPVPMPAMPTNSSWTIEMELTPFMSVDDQSPKKGFYWLNGDFELTSTTINSPGGTSYSLPIGSQNETALYIMQFEVGTGRFSFHVNGQLVYDVTVSQAVGLDLNPIYSSVFNQSIRFWGSLTQLNISSAILHPMGTSFTPSAKLSRNANTLLFFDGSIPDVSTATPVIGNERRNSSASTQNPITKTYFIQDPITLYGLSVSDDDSGYILPVQSEKSNSLQFIGSKYSTLPTKYIGGSSIYYNVGDLVKYLPTDLSINFISADGTKNKSILFNTVTGDITYEGAPYSLTVDNAEGNVYTNSIDNNGVVLKPTTTGATMLLTSYNVAPFNTGVWSNSVVIGNNPSAIDGYNKVSIGLSSGAQSNSVAVGTYTSSYGDSATALGNNANTNGNSAIALGASSSAYGYGSMAIGSSAYVNYAVTNAIALGWQSNVYNSYTMATSTTGNSYYPNSSLSFTYFYNGQSAISNGNWYISKTNNYYSSVAYTYEDQASNFASMLKTQNYQTPINSVYGVATVMARRTGVSYPNDWKIWEIKFWAQGSSQYNNSTALTIISNAVIAQGGGTSANTWSVNIENVSNFLNVKFTQTQVQSNNIAISAKIDCKLLTGN